MYCPQCGQQQIPGETRFCSRCGFPLVGVTELLSNGGVLPTLQSGETKQVSSPKREGVRQGGMLFLIGVVAVPLLAVLSTLFNNELAEYIVGLAAIIFFVGGLARMLYAALFEEGAPRTQTAASPAYLPPSIEQPKVSGNMRSAALPPPQSNPAPDRRPRPNTAEITRPPSVTENTTKLLKEEPPAH
jgi:hypothetical protein